MGVQYVCLEQHAVFEVAHSQGFENVWTCRGTQDALEFAAERKERHQTLMLRERMAQMLRPATRLEKTRTC